MDLATQPAVSQTRQSRLEQLRGERGITREELASSAQISARTLFAIEREGSRPHRSTIFALAIALGVHPDEITADANVGSELGSR